MYRQQRVAVVVLARAGSRRLPGKVLLPFGSGTVLSTVLSRLSACSWVDDVVLATTAEPEDEALARAGEELGVRVVRGSTDDLVGRVQQAVRSLQRPPDVIVCGRASDPLVMPELIEEAIMDLVDTESDLVTPFELASYPPGFAALVMTRGALERVDREARNPAWREHIESYCFVAPEPFRLRYLLAPLDLDQPELCARLELPVDYERLCTYERWLRGVPLAAQAATLLCRLRESRVWYEGSTERSLDWDLIVTSDAEPLRSLAPSVPLGIVTAGRFEVDGAQRWGLCYLEDCGAAFPRGPIFLDWRSEAGHESPRAFLARVRPLVWRLLLGGPVRSIDLGQMSGGGAPRAGFRSPRDEAFPPRIVLELDGSWHAPELVQRLCAELRREPFEELVVLGPPAAGRRALEALSACTGPRRLRHDMGSLVPGEAPFESLTIGASGRMSILARGPSASVFETSIAAFWRSPLARRARTQCLNAEQLLAREAW